MALPFATIAQALTAPKTSTSSASFSTSPSEATTTAQRASASSPAASSVRAAAVARSVAMSIPAMRKAHHVITGVPSTFSLYGWQGNLRLPETDRRVSWLRQPDPTRTLQTLLRQTLDDGLWEDRCVWRMRADLSGAPTRFQRIHPNRIQVVTDPLDPDTIAAWTIDGKLLSVDEFAADYLHFDFAGLGGMRRFGYELLALYADLQAAAGNYARAPHPKAILKNHGADLEDDEIDALLTEWDTARATQSTGYLSDEMDYDVVDGWNPEELQLVQSREHAALEVARLVGLPAKALDAKSGDSLTYANIVEWRRDLLEALRPWLSVIEQHLSMDDRASTPRGRVLPLGIVARFDVDAYTRNSPQDRMTTWATAKSSGILSLDEIRAAEPLATSDQLPPAATTEGTPQ